jgi:lipopolysaccharide exporter
MNILKSASHLILASVGGQALTLLITPILSRLYTPSDFAIWAIFISISSTIIVGSAFRYDISILLPASIRESIRISILSVKNILFTTFLSFLILVAVAFLKSNINLSFTLLPLSILIGGINLVLTANLNYKKEYKKIAISKFMQTFFTVACNLLLFFILDFETDGFELVFSILAGQLICMLIQCNFLNINFNRVINLLYKKYPIKIAKRYYDFAVFSLPASYLANIMTWLPVFVLGIFFTNELVGQYALANRILIVPLAIIGGSLSQVLLKDFSEKINNKESLVQSIFFIWGVSFILLAIPTSIVFIHGEYLISILLGDQWSVSGKLITLLIIPTIFNFCLNLTSVSHAVFRLQHFSLIISILTLLVKIGVTFFFLDSYVFLLLTYVLVDTFFIIALNVLVIFRMMKIL